MTDRELLELAAKAAGMTIQVLNEGPYSIVDLGCPTQRLWNPLADDGDALRLAVKLAADIEIQPQTASVWVGMAGDASALEHDVVDFEAATRRAIVRAAAGIAQE